MFSHVLVVILVPDLALFMFKDVLSLSYFFNIFRIVVLFGGKGSELGSILIVAFCFVI